MIQIKHTVVWELMCKRNQAQNNLYNICKNSEIVYVINKFQDKLMLNNNTAFKYETPYKGTFEITQ